MADALPPLAEIDAACRALDLAISAWELHGGLCGWLAGGGEATPQWLAKAMVDADLPAPLPDSVLDCLCRATAAQLDDRSFGFSLLLPGSEATLAARSEALFDWCRGFVGGFGLGAGEEPPLSEEGREALHDLARLAAATAQDDGDDEDEAALAEIEEFVRVAVLLLHGDCTLGPRYRGRLN